MIFTITGELVKNIPITSVQMEWTGYNTNGLPVATGIYLYAIQYGGKALNSGKFLLINGS